MRSRYSAFVTGQISYLRDTLHPDHRHDFDEEHTRQWSETSQWQGLSVRSCVPDTPDEGYVEFVARFQTEAGKRASTTKPDALSKITAHGTTLTAFPAPAL